MKHATRFLTIPDPIDLSTSETIRSPSGKYPFTAFFVDLVPELPCNDTAQAESMEVLVRLLLHASPGMVCELREADHASLLTAVNAFRKRLPPDAQIALMPFFVAVAKASPTAPVRPANAVAQA